MSYFSPIIAHAVYGIIAGDLAILIVLIGGIWKLLSWAIGTPPSSRTSGLVKLATFTSLGEADMVRAQLEESGISASMPQAEQLSLSLCPVSFPVFVAAEELQNARAVLERGT